MMWLIGGAYCFVLWLIFAKLKLLKFSLPIAIICGAVGPVGILTLLFCAQYYHPMASEVRVFQKIVPIVPQMTQAGRVTKVAIEPNSPIAEGEVLFEVDRVPYENRIQQLTAAVDEAMQSVKVAEASVDVAAAALKRATSDADFAGAERDRYQKLVESEAATQQALEQAQAKYEQAAAALTEAVTTQKQAYLSVELAQSRRQQLESQLQNARYDLEQTTVLAPGNGFVTNLQLQKGMLVGGPGATSVMSFVEDRDDRERGVVLAMFPQKNYLLVQQGQYAEVMLDAYPGEIFPGKVETTIDASGAGQLTASGELPADLGSSRPAQFAVRIRLDDADDLRLPAGARGQAAVYTQNIQIAGIPIMFLLRAQSWLNYLF